MVICRIMYIMKFLYFIVQGLGRHTLARPLLVPSLLRTRSPAYGSCV